MQNHYKLNIPVKLLKDNIDMQHYIDLVYYKPESAWAMNLVKHEEFLTEESIEFFKNFGIEILSECIFFRGNTNSNLDIHIDTIDGVTHCIWGINIVWGSANSEMFWYSSLPGKKNNIKISTGGTPYIQFDRADVVCIESARIEGPCLVRTNIPHNVTNRDIANIRWCLSIRATAKFSTWEETVEFFKPLII